jgi:hypothetical protein
MKPTVFMDLHHDRALALDELRKLLFDLFSASERGVMASRYARAHGYTDGYMKGLLSAGLVNERELRVIVSEARARVAGAATRVVHRLDQLPRGSA